MARSDMDFSCRVARGRSKGKLEVFQDAGGNVGRKGPQQAIPNQVTNLLFQQG